MCDCWFPLLRVVVVAVVVCLFTEREVIAGGRRRSFIAAGSARRVRFRDSMSNGACGAEYAARSNTSSSILGIAVSKVNNRLDDTRITIMAGTVWGEERGKTFSPLFGTHK